MALVTKPYVALSQIQIWQPFAFAEEIKNLVSLVMLELLSIVPLMNQDQILVVWHSQFGNC